MLRRRLIVLISVLLLPVVAVQTPAGAVDEDETPPSVTNPCEPGQPGVIYGTEGDDTLVGTNADDTICGLGGDDVIDGRNGSDVVYGGAGEDTIDGGNGEDVLFGGEDDDVIRGGNGNDELLGGAGNDTLDAGSGNDVAVGEDGNDRLIGGRGNDRLFGLDGDDDLEGGQGDDLLNGGDADDVLDGGKGTDTCVNGEIVSECETGDEAIAPRTGDLSVAAPAPPGQVVSSGGISGLSVVIDSNGGIFPWDIHVVPARDYMHGILDVLASAAYEIGVPSSAPAFESATLTIPYGPDLLDGFDEQALRIYTFDDDAQLWVPVPGTQVVDASANTVTATVDHFSVFAVLKIASAADWQALFDLTPVRCVPEGDPNATGIDVTFLIDRSGSMSWNDPNNLRVDGAQLFVDEMRDDDRASVVRFTSFASTLLGLTELDTAANRQAVADALDLTRGASGGTNISSAVSSAISILSNNGGGGRLRIAILLTDGQSSYNTALTTQAADEAIAIYTIGLGAGVDTALLQGIADGTGGQYLPLADANQLPDLYQELIGDLIDDGTDTDGDGLTDCEERNGLFVPIVLTLPGILGGGSITLPNFIFTDPNLADTDEDGLSDGEELERRDLRDNPALVDEYSFLIDAGVTTYFKMLSNPTKVDTDEDGLTDAEEVEFGTNPLLEDSDFDGVSDLIELINGTDPNEFTPGDLGIDDLVLPPFTLFQPDFYDERPVIRKILAAEGTTLTTVFFNDNPVGYALDGRCLTNCDAIEDAAAARPNDNGFGICIGDFGDCVTDQDQIRDIVREARNRQGIFDDTGRLRREFVAEQAFFACLRDHAFPVECSLPSLYDNAPEGLTPDLLWAGATTAVRETLPEGRVRLSPGAKAGIAAFLVAAVVAAANFFDGDTAEQVVEFCDESPTVELLNYVNGLHPCEALPVFAPGGNIPEATNHKVDAIFADPGRGLLLYSPEEDVEDRGVSRDWYNAFAACDDDARDAFEELRGSRPDCDELPYYSTTTSGPGAAIRLIDRGQNRSEGGSLSRFYGACDNVSADFEFERTPYLVIPMPGGPRTTYHCGQLR